MDPMEGGVIPPEANPGEELEQLRAQLEQAQRENAVLSGRLGEAEGMIRLQAERTAATPGRSYTDVVHRRSYTDLKPTQLNFRSFLLFN